MTKRILTPIAERLARYIQSGAPDECWPWIGATNWKGYGHITRGRRGEGHAFAHRAVWELVNGPVSRDLDVCHRCDIPPCCNLAHLFVGTRSENMRDMEAKGRGNHPGTAGNRNGSRLYPERLKRGTDNSAAKLNEERVREIRVLLAAGCGLTEIGRRFGVSVHAIVCIRDRKTWAWLD